MNILCVVIFFKIKMHKTAVGLHLLWIGICDIIHMIYGITYAYPLQELLQIHHYDALSRMFCRLASTLGKPVSLASDLLITSATFERFLSVAFPFKVTTWPMVKISKIIVVCILLVCSGVLVMWVVMYTDDMCWSNPASYESFFVEATHIATVSIHFISNTLVFIFSAGIVTALLAKKKIPKSQQESKNIRVTLMLFTIAVTFLLASMSHFVNFIIGEYFVDLSQAKIDMSTALWAMILFYDIYHWSNFVIYFIFLKSFRAYFQCMFCKPEVSGSGSSLQEQVTPNSQQPSCTSSKMPDHKI